MYNGGNPMRKSNPDLENSVPLIFEDSSERPGYKDDSYLLRHQVYFNKDDLLEQKMVEEQLAKMIEEYEAKPANTKDRN